MTVSWRGTPGRPRRRWLGGLVLAALATAAPGRGAAADDPGFCDAIVEVMHASRTDFDRWRGAPRGSPATVYDTERALPRAVDCRIERASGETRYTCEWEYHDFEEASARAAAERFVDGLVDCLGHRIARVEPQKETAKGRRRTTLLAIGDDASHSAELRVSSGIVPDGSLWYVEFSANRARPGR